MTSTKSNLRAIRNYVSSVYIAEGLEEDTEELIKRCLQSDSLSYHVFCNIWKDMNFGAIYQGRLSAAEVAELLEEAILIAKRFMVRSNGSVEESIAGLYVVYALVRLQPFTRFAALKLTPEDMNAITYIEETARRQKRYDVLYILGYLLIEGPCEFHVAHREYGLELPVRKTFDATTSINQFGVQPRGVFSHTNEELDLLREMSGLTKRYTHFKKTVVDSDQEIKDILGYFKDETTSDLSTTLRNHINGDQGVVSRNKPDEEEASSSKAETVTAKSIKQRAMQSSVKSIRHLSSVLDGKPKKTTKRQESDIKTKQGKIRTGSPKKVTTPKKNNNKSKTLTTSPKFKKPKRRRNCVESSEDDDDDDDLQWLLGDSDLDVSTEKESEDDEENDFVETQEVNIKKIKKVTKLEAVSKKVDQEKHAAQMSGKSDLKVTKLNKTNNNIPPQKSKANITKAETYIKRKKTLPKSMDRVEADNKKQREQEEKKSEVLTKQKSNIDDDLLSPEPKIKRMTNNVPSETKSNRKRTSSRAINKLEITKIRKKATPATITSEQCLDVPTAKESQTVKEDFAVPPEVKQRRTSPRKNKNC